MGPVQRDDRDALPPLLHRMAPDGRLRAGDGVEFEMYEAKDGLNYIELWFAVRKAK